MNKSFSKIPRAKRESRAKKAFFVGGLVLLITLVGAFWARRINEKPRLAEQPPSQASGLADNTSLSLAGSVASDNSQTKSPPPPVDMSRVKRQGCVTDGLLTEYSPENDQYISLVNRSSCYYLHRAIETWLEAPDFSSIQRVMSQVKPGVVYGMFIAEAISTKHDYKDKDTGHVFDFGRMCHKGSRNVWGEHTCKPAFSSREYRDYVEYITHKAIDLGVQSFMFGQIYMQEGSKTKYARSIVKDIRDYAEKKGVDVIIGAQTGSISDEKYLGIFDYVEGGVGIDSRGNIENGPCFSRRGSCWALLWNKAFSAKSKNVLLNLDWTGIKSDDLDIFARMPADTRSRTLRNLYNYFTAQNMGFMMPFFGVLDHTNGGCSGPKKSFYSPNNIYSCQDETAINSIISGPQPNK